MPIVDWRRILTTKITILAQLNYNSKQLSEQFKICQHTILRYLNAEHEPHKKCSIMVDLLRHTYSICGQFIMQGVYRLSYHNEEMLRLWDEEEYLVLPFALHEVKILDLYPREIYYHDEKIEKAENETSRRDQTKEKTNAGSIGVNDKRG